MYTPPHFREDRPEVLADLIRQTGAATFVTHTAEGYQATHAPVVLREHGTAWTLECHMSRANPHWRAVAGAPLPTLAIFQGPEAYVSPSLYATKREGGKVVPTWAYVAVHVEGVLEAMDDGDFLRRHLEALTLANERDRAEPWAVSDAPADYVAGLMRGIVALRLTVTKIEGKRKLNQHKPDADRQGVIEGLATGNARDRAVADLMRGAEAERK